MKQAIHSQPSLILSEEKLKYKEIPLFQPVLNMKCTETYLRKLGCKVVNWFLAGSVMVPWQAFSFTVMHPWVS
jgi:hypothetical protein